MQYTINNIQTAQKSLTKRSQNDTLRRSERRCTCENCLDCILKIVMTTNNKHKMKNKEEMTGSLLSIYGKLIERGLLLAVSLVLLLSSTGLYAQDNRHIAIEGTEFSIGTLLEEVERQADITILNRGPAVPRGEMITTERSQYFVRDVIDQVLAGTEYIFVSSAVYTVIVVEHTDARGLRTFERVFVDTRTNRIVGINDIFGDEALGARAGTVDQMLVTQVLSGRTYTYHSSGDFTIITVTAFEGGREVERQIVVDMATGRVVPIESLLSPLMRMPMDDVLFDTFTFPTDYFPRIAIKTNLLYGATTTPNLGMEFFLNRFLTLDITAGWNPFVHTDNVKFAHWMVQPTLRFWITEPFNGHFVGLSGMYSNFNVSGLSQPYDWFGMFPRLARGGDPTRERSTYRFRGDAFGASLQYGHQWILSPRWSIEASINVGWLRLHYQEWEGGWCGTYIGHARRDWLGPTNAGISLIYIIR